MTGLTPERKARAKDIVLEALTYARRISSTAGEVSEAVSFFFGLFLAIHNMNAHLGKAGLDQATLLQMFWEAKAMIDKADDEMYKGGQ